MSDHIADTSKKVERLADGGKTMGDAVEDCHNAMMGFIVVLSESILGLMVTMLNFFRRMFGVCWWMEYYHYNLDEMAHKTCRGMDVDIQFPAFVRTKFCPHCGRRVKVKK